jgi:hypothetical protein
MASSGMLSRVALVRTDISVEVSASVIRVTRIGEIGTLAVTSNRHSGHRVLVPARVVPSSPIPVTLMKEALRHGATSQKTPFLSIAIGSALLGPRPLQKGAE